MKIMRIIARLNIGGPAIHVTLLTDEFRQRGHDSSLVCGVVGASEGDMHYLCLERNIVPVVVPQLGREISPLRDFYAIWALYRLMRQQKPDVVHTHTAKAGFLGRIAAWLARVPVRVHTFHGHVFQGYFSPSKTKLFLYLERFCARLSSRIITISPSLRDELVNIYKIAPAERFSVLSLGLDLASLTHLTDDSHFRTKHHLPKDKKLVGIIGRLVPIKNHERFLQVAQRVSAHRNDVHFVIIGDGECRPDIERTIHNNGLSDEVSIIGWVHDIGAALAALDVLALTSDNEGTPVSIIEAMAARVPVVSTDVGGVADLLGQGDFGKIIAMDEVDAFASAISEILDGDLPNLDTAQANALGNYSIRRLVDDLDTLYKDLLYVRH